MATHSRRKPLPNCCACGGDAQEELLAAAARSRNAIIPEWSPTRAKSFCR